MTCGWVLIASVQAWKFSTILNLIISIKQAYGPWLWFVLAALWGGL